MEVSAQPLDNTDFEIADRLVNTLPKTYMVRHVFGIHGKSSFQAHFGPVLQLYTQLRRPEVGPRCVDPRVEFEIITCGGRCFQKQTLSSPSG
jgi:hypothetical protein